MNRPQQRRRGVVIGVSALAGLATAAFGVAGVVRHAGVSAQRQDVALSSASQATRDALAAIGYDPDHHGAAIQFDDYQAFDTWHADLITSQVAQNDSLFDQGIALQQSIYHWADQNNFDQWLFVDPDADASTNLFNGAFTRFVEAMVVGQAIQQVQWDHLLGVNQTLGEGGYETLIADALYNDLSGTGIADGSHLDDALSALNGLTDMSSFDAFHDALVDLHGALLQTAFADLFGMFSV